MEANVVNLPSTRKWRPQQRGLKRWARLREISPSYNDGRLMLVPHDLNQLDESLRAQSRRMFWRSQYNDRDTIRLRPAESNRGDRPGGVRTAGETFRGRETLIDEREVSPRYGRTPVLLTSPD